MKKFIIYLYKRFVGDLPIVDNSPRFYYPEPGTVLYYHSLRVKAVEATHDCSDCLFRNSHACSDFVDSYKGLTCDRCYRPDGKSIIFNVAPAENL